MNARRATLPRMAQLRFRARASWVVRWGGLALCLALLLLTTLSAFRDTGLWFSVPSIALSGSATMLPGVVRIEVARAERSSSERPSARVFCERKESETPHPRWKWWRWRYRTGVPWLSNGPGPLPRFWLV